MTTKLKQIFDYGRIIGLAGETNSGKTNNLIAMIKEYREAGGKANIYIFGVGSKVLEYLEQYNIQEVSSMRQITRKKNCVLIIDEFQRLQLNDRRYREELKEFVAFVHHNNIFCILSSPLVSEYNSIIGRYIDTWLIKRMYKDDCVNGSQLKKTVDYYKGRFKKNDFMDVPVDKMLLTNNHKEIVLSFKYIEGADTKKDRPEVL